MDFEKSKLKQFNNYNSLIKQIDKFLTSVKMACNNNSLYLNYEYYKIIKLKSFSEEQI